MNLFTWLVLGHLVGDWLLQNNWMAQGKRQALVTLAGLVHFSIYTVSVMLAFWLASQTLPTHANLLLLGALVFCSHWLIDATNLVDQWMRLLGQTNIPMVRLMVDQTFHIVILALIAHATTLP